MRSQQNEKAKLTAGSLNGIAIAVALAGALTPTRQNPFGDRSEERVRLPLTEEDINHLGRLDAIVDARSDAGFERADQ